MCSTSLSSGLLQSHVSSLSLPSVSSVSNTQVAMMEKNWIVVSFTRIHCVLVVSQVHPGSSTAYSLSSSQPFASCLSSAPTLAPILNQAQTSLPGQGTSTHLRSSFSGSHAWGGAHHYLFLFSEPDLDDCRFPCQGNSPRESLSSQYASFPSW